MPRDQEKCERCECWVRFWMPLNACEVMIEEEGRDKEGFVEPWERPVVPLKDKDCAGSDRAQWGSEGAGGIALRKGWGEAWFIVEEGGEEDSVPVLAATLGVERGASYSFRIQGDDDKTKSADYNALYITDSDRGGSDVNDEKVYAEPVSGELCKLTWGSEDAKDYMSFYEGLDDSCLQDDDTAKGAGVLHWKVAMDTPDTVYYQSRSNAFLGWKIRVFDEGKMDEAELEKANAALNLTTETADTCEIFFKCELKTFSSCRKGLDENFGVYWDLDDDELTTLFTAEADEQGGYIGWGWGIPRWSLVTQ